MANIFSSTLLANQGPSGPSLSSELELPLMNPNDSPSRHVLSGLVCRLSVPSLSEAGVLRLLCLCIYHVQDR